MSFAKIQDPFVRLPPTPPDFLDNADEDVNDETIRLALHVLRTERDALAHILDLYHSDRAAQRSFNHAVNAIGASSLRGGRVIVTGMGKSGKIGLKFVATLNSLAIRSAFLHPTEAMHGDLGMIGPVRRCSVDFMVGVLTCIHRRTISLSSSAIRDERLRSCQCFHT